MGYWGSNIPKAMFQLPEVDYSMGMPYWLSVGYRPHPVAVYNGGNIKDSYINML